MQIQALEPNCVVLGTNIIPFPHFTCKVIQCCTHRLGWACVIGVIYASNNQKHVVLVQKLNQRNTTQILPISNAYLRNVAFSGPLSLHKYFLQMDKSSLRREQHLRQHQGNLLWQMFCWWQVTAIPCPEEGEELYCICKHWRRQETAPKDSHFCFPSLIQCNGRLAALSSTK